MPVAGFAVAGGGGGAGPGLAAPVGTFHGLFGVAAGAGFAPAGGADGSTSGGRMPGAIPPGGIAGAAMSPAAAAAAMAGSFIGSSTASAAGGGIPGVNAVGGGRSCVTFGIPGGKPVGVWATGPDGRAAAEAVATM